MFLRLIRTTNDPTLLIARLVLGIIFFAHGAQKMLGWYGGPGFSGRMQGFTDMGIPSFLAFLAIAAEFFGGLGLIVGFLGRIAAFGIMVNMIVAILAVHAPFGLFMNWTGNQPGEGFEYHLLAIVTGLVVLVHGSGMLSVDHVLQGTITQRRRQIGFEKAA